MNETFLKCLKLRSTCLRDQCFTFGEGRGSESRFLIETVNGLTLLLDDWLEELVAPKYVEEAKEECEQNTAAWERQVIVEMLYEMKDKAVADCDFERACAFRDAAKRIALRGGTDEVEKDKFR